MQSSMLQLVNRSRSPAFTGTSLFDIGYRDAGLDDAFQLCSTNPTPSDPYTMHTPDGRFRIDTGRFPDMKGMVDYGHSLGITVGWYVGNCLCQENASHAGLPPGITYPPGGFLQYEMAQLKEYGFDGVKVDGCGQDGDASDHSRVAVTAPYVFDYMPAYGVIENCNNGHSPFFPGFNPPPGKNFYPFSMYRAYGDICFSWPCIMDEITALVQQGNWNNSYPGLWAYGDMLITGNSFPWELATGPYMSFIDSRSQFGAYCILSSPLILGTNINDDGALARQLPIVTNKEAIAIDQTYYGFSGANFSGSSSLTNGLFLYKPQSWDRTRVAIMAMNTGETTASGTLVFSDVPGLLSGRAITIRDVWSQTNLITTTAPSYAFGPLEPHDHVFLMLSV